MFAPILYGLFQGQADMFCDFLRFKADLELGGAALHGTMGLGAASLAVHDEGRAGPRAA